jgi:hypothetical protein
MVKACVIHAKRGHAVDRRLVEAAFLGAGDGGSVLMNLSHWLNACSKLNMHWANNRLGTPAAAVRPTRYSPPAVIQRGVRLSGSRTVVKVPLILSLFNC